MVQGGRAGDEDTSGHFPKLGKSLQSDMRGNKVREREREIVLCKSWQEQHWKERKERRGSTCMEIEFRACFMQSKKYRELKTGMTPTCQMNKFGLTCLTDERMLSKSIGVSPTLCVHVRQQPRPSVDHIEYQLMMLHPANVQLCSQLTHQGQIISASILVNIRGCRLQSLRQVLC
jgi:hypothetical protein